MKFDQILTKFDQIFTIYVKKHKMHVDNFQECNFLKLKKSNVKNHPGFEGVLGYWGIGGGIGRVLRGELID